MRESARASLPAPRGPQPGSERWGKCTARGPFRGPLKLPGFGCVPKGFIGRGDPRRQGWGWEEDREEEGPIKGTSPGGRPLRALWKEGCGARRQGRGPGHLPTASHVSWARLGGAEQATGKGRERQTLEPRCHRHRGNCPLKLQGASLWPRGRGRTLLVFAPWMDRVTVSRPALYIWCLVFCPLGTPSLSSPQGLCICCSL